jgi:hypothetical protein
MKLLFKTIALTALAAVVVLYVQHQLVTTEAIEDPTEDIWH